MHTEPAIALAGKGYAMLLEKPMAPTEEECVRIVEAVKRAGILFGVCHVLRYTSYTQALKQVLDSGAIGQVISIQHLEPVGYWHQAHSFVRGNWRNSAESASMLLAKPCHALDWLRYAVGSACLSVSSFGSLTHFKRSEKPAEAGAATRCLECAFEPRCPHARGECRAAVPVPHPVAAGHGAACIRFGALVSDRAPQGGRLREVA